MSALVLISLGPVTLTPDPCKGRNAEGSSQESEHSLGMSLGLGDLPTCQAASPVASPALAKHESRRCFYTEPSSH